ncbi:MAG: hypothetical protein KC731_30755, partial [Myxococcales bacterium]|nr:hypothetical protein [Myxococcales bacterium]
QVMAPWSTPNSAVGGFDCYFASDRAVVRPTDGRLVYDNTFENLLRTFTCDGCPLSSNQPYPSNPLVNDALLQTPQCPSWTTIVRTAFYADGTYLYACGPLLEWWRATTLVYDSSLGPLRHVAAGLLLTETHVIEEQGTIAHPITGLAPGTWIAVRAYQQGFVIAVDAPQPELFYVDELGAASLIGVYPPPPPGQVVHNYRGAMDGCHNLFQQGPGGPSPLHDLIVRREIGGQSVVVYDEAWNPEVKLHGAWLITGP